MIRGVSEMILPFRVPFFRVPLFSETPKWIRLLMTYSEACTACKDASPVPNREPPKPIKKKEYTLNHIRTQRVQVSK